MSENESEMVICDASLESDEDIGMILGLDGLLDSQSTKWKKGAAGSLQAFIKEEVVGARRKATAKDSTFKQLRKEMILCDTIAKQGSTNAATHEKSIGRKQNKKKKPANAQHQVVDHDD